MNEELERLRAERDEARGDVEKLRASREFAYNESYLRMEEILQLRFRIHRVERERDSALKLAEHYRSTLVEMSKDGCDYAEVGGCAKYGGDRREWCWPCIAAKALEDRP